MQQNVGGPIELADAIRSGRKRLGLSQAALAGRLGVARMTISRLERGEDVSIGTAFDAMRACGLTIATVATRGWLTASEHSHAIGRELDRDENTFALRLLRQAVEDLDYLIEKRDDQAIEQFLGRPPASGDERWDALLSLALVQGCQRRGISTPTWAKAEPLPEPFFPSRPSRRFIGRTVERTPASFAEVNVWIDPRELTYA